MYIKPLCNNAKVRKNILNKSATFFKTFFFYIYVHICIKIERKRAYENHKYLTQYSNNTYKEFYNKIDFELRLFFIRHMFCLDCQFIYDRRIHINCILCTIYSVCISSIFF